ncbi:ParB N-terminal-like domain-containing methyltransferase [Morganella phage Mecenats66]|nr:ParB N-terminal-like domain-containing methyltransferase [Morganella phage Mecenats66]
MTVSIKTDLNIEMWNITDLIPNPMNSKIHNPEQIQLIMRMMKQYGWTNPILMADGNILAGHGRRLAAIELGLKQVPCINLSHLNDDEQRALIIADNRSAEFGTSWDLEILKSEIDELAMRGFDTELTGFDDQAYAELFKDIPPPEQEKEKDPDAIPEISDTAIAKNGDLWILGPHKVYCGTSEDARSWDRLLGAEKADVCWTDPPYNVEFSSELAGAIENDNMSDKSFLALLNAVFTNYFAVMKPGAPVYVAYADREGRNFHNAFQDAGFKLASVLVWKKQSLVQGRADYQSIHEPIIYGWKPGARHRWYANRKVNTFFSDGSFGEQVIQNDDGTYSFILGENIITVPADAKVNVSPGSLMYHGKPRRSPGHPTIKPVELVEKHLKNSARPGDIVIDGFGGSGTTLLAAERMGMSARLIELSPKFVDLIIQRYQNYSGRIAVNADSGEEYPIKPEKDK